MRQLGVIRDKQAFSAVKVAREEYFFCGPSPGMFLCTPCSSRMTSEISHGSLLTARFRTRLLSVSNKSQNFLIDFPSGAIHCKKGSLIMCAALYFHFHVFSFWYICLKTLWVLFYYLKVDFHSCTIWRKFRVPVFYISWTVVHPERFHPLIVQDGFPLALTKM